MTYKTEPVIEFQLLRVQAAYVREALAYIGERQKVRADDSSSSQPSTTIDKFSHRRAIAIGNEIVKILDDAMGKATP